MKVLFVVLLLAFTARYAGADCVTFVDGDSNPVFSVDTDTHIVTFKDSAIAAFDRFQCLKDDDPLPPDLSFMASEASVRYAALDFTSPDIWTARSVREVFRSREEILIFLDRYYSASKQQ